MPSSSEYSDVHGRARYDPETGELTITREFDGRPSVTTTYRVSALDPHPEIGSPAVRLTKEDGSSYDVIRTAFGFECECADWHNRRQREGKPCKHILALLKTVLGAPATIGQPPSGSSN